MPARPRLPAVLVALALLVACSRDERSGEPRQPADEPEAAEAPTGVRGEERFQAGGTPPPANDRSTPPAPTSFTCTGGQRVDVGQLVAVVQLEDGRTVQIARNPDDATDFRGEALSFRLRGAEGELSRDEGGRFACTAN